MDGLCHDIYKFSNKVHFAMDIFYKLTEIVKKSQVIWQIQILFQQRFGNISSVHFQALVMKKVKNKYYNKQITTRDNGNNQSHEQEESKFNRTINTNSGAHTLTHDKIIKNPFDKNNIATIKRKQNSRKYHTTRVSGIGTLVLM